MASQRTIQALGLTFGAVALAAVLGLARDEARHEIVEPRSAVPADERPGPVHPLGFPGGGAPFDLQVAQERGGDGELGYRLTITSRLAASEAGAERVDERAPVEHDVGAFKFAYYFACDPMRAIAEPGFCDALARDVRNSEVFELSLFESFSELLAIPDALLDGFYVLQVTAAGSSGPEGEAAVLINESHFLSDGGRAHPLTINQYYAHSGANRSVTEQVRPLVVDRPEVSGPIVGSIDATSTLENQ